MNTFLCSVGAQLQSNYQIGLENNLWGVVEKYQNRIRKTSKGDQLAFIVEGIFRSLHRIETEVFVDHTPIWPANDGSVYPFRIRISDPIATSSKDARIVKHNISFMRHVDHWGGTVQGASGVFNDRLTEEDVAFLFENRSLDPKVLEPTTSETDLAEKAKKIIAHGKPKVPTGVRSPRKQHAQTYSYYRDPQVVAYVLFEAGNICELCGKPAPFEKPDGSLFLEVHHVKPLAEGGSDTIQNAVALCPNCHRACHLAKDAAAYTETLYLNVDRLRRE